MGFWSVITSIIPSAIAYTIPILMGALGGLYSERSGVTNLCIEGLMLFGVFSAAATIVKLQAIPGFSFVLAIIIGIIVAMAASLLLSLESVFAVVASVVFYHELVTPRIAIGFGTIFVAVLVSELGARMGRGK